MTTIPKIRHGIWLDEPLPEQHREWWNLFAEMHPDWELRLWTDSAELGWMETHDLFLQCRTWAGRADLLRFELMRKLGGVYIDTDVETLKPFDPLLEGDERPFAGLENDRLICPTVLGSPPGHPVWDEVLEQIRRSFHRVSGLKPNFQTGPVPFTKVFRLRDDVRVLSRETFYPVGWWEKGKLGGPYPEESFCVHHWHAGWKKSGGLIPQRSIRLGPPYERSR